jgi:hypothetical protein
MAQVDNLSPPGGSTYSSNTLYVGDGTWDSSRNTFLLPNLVGLNFETMRYNGRITSVLSLLVRPEFSWKMLTITQCRDGEQIQRRATISHSD